PGEDGTPDRCVADPLGRFVRGLEPRLRFFESEPGRQHTAKGREGKRLLSFFEFRKQFQRSGELALRLAESEQVDEAAASLVQPRERPRAYTRTENLETGRHVLQTRRFPAGEMEV